MESGPAQALCGGHSQARAPRKDEVEFLTSDKVRNLVLQRAGATSSSELVPVLVTTQVVAGTVYKAKYRLDNMKHVHAKIFEPLPCNQGDPELMNFDDNCGADDPLEV
eukprot:CAMPEP_0117004630 /NCGR_PEP_ID=MMETSP0472-20121206/5530_1 /TAXON_ID=693140 ORGANISM="Tiarina fusus, Strain LIS" /NCGR_SAMPLE_ID=MMETSP0472 /ASSEMBLY_ACC=CAM_ASM_000603 /LENGTH=107 /DNA_ID=CAMNT_0004705631 /DNA_START=41 /DNA_END=364 /DNA_ORIENTATION=+